MINEPNLMDKEIENHMEVTILNYRILKISFNNNVLFWKKKRGEILSRQGRTLAKAKDALSKLQLTDKIDSLTAKLQTDNWTFEFPHKSYHKHRCMSALHKSLF